VRGELAPIIGWVAQVRSRSRHDLAQLVAFVAWAPSVARDENGQAMPGRFEMHARRSACFVRARRRI